MVNNIGLMCISHDMNIKLLYVGTPDKTGDDIFDTVDWSPLRSDYIIIATLRSHV